MESPGPDSGIDHLVVFVSYARVDGAPYVRRVQDRLASMPVDLWVDNDSWPDEKIPEAIERGLSGSDLVLFVMTSGSVTRHPWCDLELDRAHSKGIPIIPLRFDRDAELTIRIESRPPVDFTTGTPDGWLELATQLNRAASVEGRIRLQDKRIHMLERQVRDAGVGLRRRIEAEIGERRARIEALRRRADDPAAASRQQRERISAGQERERRPERMPFDRTRVRCVHAPPAVPPNQFRDRGTELDELERLLGDRTVRLVSLVGPAGNGKTAMVSQLWTRVRGDAPALPLDGVIYLAADGYWPVTAASLLQALARVVPDDDAMGRLHRRLREPLPWLDKLDEVVAALAGSAVLVVVDSIDELLDDAGELRNRDLRELVLRLLQRDDHRVRLLLVGEREPVQVMAAVPGVGRVRRLDEGLPATELRAVLSALDTDGLLGLASVSDDEVTVLHTLTGGSPRALELAVGILRREPEWSVAELIRLMAEARGRAIVPFLFAWVFNQLELDERRVVQALAIFRRPVRPWVVDDLLRDYVKGLESRRVLEGLYRRRLVRRDGDRYYLPPRPEGELVLKSIRYGDQAERDDGPPRFTQVALLHRAAGYFADTRVPERDVEQIDDLRAEFTEIELRIRGAEQAVALARINEINDHHLHGWGQSDALIPALTAIDGGLDRQLQIRRLSLLAAAESQHEDHDTAARHVIRALALTGRVAWPARRVRLLLQLAGEYLWRGRVALAEACYRRARRWAFWSDIPVEKASARAGLAACEGERGRFQRALRHHRAAFRLLKRAPVGSADEIWPELLHNAGWFHLYQGRTETAHNLFVEGRRFAEEHRNWVMAARCMISEAELLILLGGLPAATALAGRAAEIGVPADHAGLCRDAKEVLALACLCTGDLSTATSATTVAARRRRSVFGLGLAGIVAYRTGDRRSAHDLFEQARQRAEGPDRREERDFQAFDDHALVLCGLALCGEPEALPRAIALYRSARAMTSAPGPVLRAVRLLTQFGSDDDDGVLARARLAASGETTGGARRTRLPGSAPRR